MRKDLKEITRREFLELAAVGTAGAAVSSLVVPSAFAATPKRGGTVKVGVSYLMHSTDPHRYSGAWADQANALAHEGLTKPVSTAERNRIIREKGPEYVPDVQPMLCDGWDTEKSGARYVFHLKKGVKFHNGKELDSGDVEWSWKRIADPVHIAGGRKMLTTFLKSIETPDRYTVVANLSQPYFAFPAANVWGRVVILPKDSIPHGVIWGVTRTSKPPGVAPPGLGPFKLVEYMQKQRMVFQPHNDYRIPGLPYLDKVIFQVISDDSARTMAVRAGDVDYIWSADSTWQRSVIKGDQEDWLLKRVELKKEGLSYFLSPGGSALTLYLNAHSEKDTPFKDERVRLALDYSIDKEKLADILFGKLAIATGQGFYPDLSPWGFANVKPRQRNIEKAKALLKEAGYPNGIDVEFKYTPTWGKNDLMAQIVQQMSKEAGFRMKLTSLVGSQYWANLRTANYHIMVYLLGGDDPMGFHYSLGHTDPAKPYNGRSASLWIKDQVLDIYLDDMASENDLQRRKAAFRKVHERFWEKAYVIPYCRTIGGPVWNSKKLKNFNPEKYNQPERAFREAWIDS
jgi:peptide/nickel transport system substrate-binding protein